MSVYVHTSHGQRDWLHILGTVKPRCSEPKREAHLQHGRFSSFEIHPGVELLDQIILFLVVLNYFKIMPDSAVLI